ncbi:metal ABC transporter permease [Jannaschia aquimarina]|uniref:MntB_2 protein n=1 Tax=Jannaschia aquimarina TaxID=935700 RepID=A0A0D1EIV6_9RHOB|nr:metal ABC transporter permease [Jannaschia aquimarina]KIT16816.1 Manganese transport system membrane protein MntB [Jannaschia aquimarina]SNT13655.1 manganese/iron transport system permease protein [Jannaschia aquimarina]
MESLTFLWQLPFLRDATLTALLVAGTCGALSPFLVLKGWSLIGDAIAHAVLPGVAIAYFMGLPLIAGAFVAGMGSALLTGWLDANSRVKRDTLMGVVFSGMFAVGTVLIVAFPTDVHLDHILFGNLLGVSPFELGTAAVVAAIVVLALGARWRDFLTHAFDESHARAIGLRTTWIANAMLAMISAAVVAALGAVGIVLAIALLITPGAIGFLLARSFSAMMGLSVGVSLLSAVSGMWLSVAIDASPAASIVMVLTLAFLGAFAVSRWRDRRALRP